MTTTQQPDPFGASPEEPKGPSGPRAGFWIRFGASFADGCVLLVPYLVIAVTVGEPAANTLNLLLAATYYTLLEGSPSGQTLGKKLCGIRVIDLRIGGPIGPGRAFIRWLGRFVSFFVFGLGFLWMLWDKEKQTWHDKMANAVVVPVSAYPVG